MEKLQQEQFFHYEHSLGNQKASWNHWFFWNSALDKYRLNHYVSIFWGEKTWIFLFNFNFSVMDFIEHNITKYLTYSHSVETYIWNYLERFFSDFYQNLKSFIIHPTFKYHCQNHKIPHKIRILPSAWLQSQSRCPLQCWGNLQSILFLFSISAAVFHFFMRTLRGQAS